MNARKLSDGDVDVVCVHGFLGEPDDWRPLAAALGKPFAVRALALPGHGSPPVKDFESAARRLAAELRKRPGAHLIGYSMGGRLALAAALRPGVAVASLTIISASPGIETGLARAERARADDRLADDLERRGLPAFVRDWYAKPLFASLADRPALLRDLIARRARGRAAPIAAALRALTIGRQPPLGPRLHALRAPALFVAGERDATYRDVLARAAALCPRARLLIVPDAGHVPHLERPDFTGARVREFLEAVR
jgi:2-succinyl-6-hydroxy-2,4-cyclohexadiene-1-carboxylate synthase